MIPQKIFSSISTAILCLILISCSKNSDTTPAPNPGQTVLPEVSVLNVSQPITANSTTLQFYINLNKSSNLAVSMDYSLVDGTAVSPKDYISASGTLTIPAGKVQATVDVQVNGDATNLRRPNVQFALQLSKPVQCTLSTTTAYAMILTEDGTYLPTDNSGYATPTTYPGYTLVWSDEFSGSTLDLNTWTQEIGNGSGGWGNNELEYYTNSTKNCFLSNGNLIIEARKEAIGGFNYSSTRMKTQNKKTFKFGRIDIRAKLPVGKGIWPALWMLGSNITSVGWPACGEMDIMELIGTYPGRVSATMHWKPAAGAHAQSGKDYNLMSGDFSQQFHVFSMVWMQDLIKCYVDDNLYLTVTSTDVGVANYPFNADQFFIFNVAVGGNWPGPPDATTPFPQRMFVDYVRVFQ
ncbi:MAG: family 16 glycosylhydrolase [Prolixibacteraceae bacterium]|jgi:beta-glucanase (GH16 family)|nr:family 16 glycosylhydrolase [Prolixibacteraceae bacterium]